MALAEFQRRVAARVSGLDKDSDLVRQRLAKLVKRMDKCFEDKGDFALPGEEKIWSKVSGKECGAELDSEAIVGAGEGCLVVEKVCKDSGSWFIKLNRLLLLETAVPRAVLGDYPKVENPLRLRVMNCELQRAGRSPSALSQLRCHLVANLLRRLASEVGHDVSETGGDFTVALGCSDVKYLRQPEGAQGHQAHPLQVGVVLESTKSKRKSEASSIVPTYNKLFQHYRSIALTRDTPASRSEEQWLRNLHASASADMSLQLLGVLSSSPVAVSEDGSQQAASVLYNYVRMVHIVNVFSSSTSEELPAASDVDFKLLREPEEWELVFNFLLPLEELLTSELRETSDFSNLRLHRLPQLLFGAAAAFSRYYNRVHVLKEPTPSLLPAMRAKVYFLMAIQAAFEKIFQLLDIQPIYNM